MPRESYPLFREYSLVIRDWLRDISFLPRLDRYTASVDKVLRSGTTRGGVNQSEIHLSGNHYFQVGHIISLKGTEYNDEYYSVSNVAGNVLILDLEYRRIRADEDFTNSEEKPEVKRSINVIYANMRRSEAMIAQPMRNGQIDSPGISFFISDYQYRVEKSRPRENFYTRRYKDNNTGVSTGSARVSPLLEYQVHYTVNIWSVYQQEMDILQYQIISEFNPEKYFWIGDKDYGLDYKGDRMDREHKGQWCHALTDAVADVSDLEPGDAQDRVLRTEISFMLNNAYLPQPFDKDQSIIGSIDIDTVLE